MASSEYASNFYGHEIPAVRVSIPVGQPNPNDIATVNPAPSTPDDLEVPVHGCRLVMVRCGLD